MAISGITYGTSSILNQSVLNLKNQMTTLQSQLTTGEKSTTYAGMGVNEGFDRRAVATGEHFRLHRHHDQRQHQYRRRQHRVAGDRQYRNHRAERRQQHGANPEQQRADPVSYTHLRA